MIRSMFTAINSLYSHQQYMDVVADNLANVNTPGYKSSYVSFQDQFTQTLSVGAGPTENLGGINPTQIGLGSVLGTVSPKFTQGALQSTGRTLDLAIQGDGFFIYESLGQNVYSRDGNLLLDAEGYLVNGSTGARIQGWTADFDTGELEAGGPVDGIRIPIDSAVAVPTSRVFITGNLNSQANRIQPANPPLPGEINLGNYSVTFGVYDSLGEVQDITIQFVRTAQPDPLDPTSGTPLEWEAHYILDDTIPLYDKVAFDAANPILTVETGEDPPGTVPNLTFNQYGQIDYSSQQIVISNVPGSPGTLPRDIRVDLSDMTMLASPYSAAASSQDGVAGGGLNGFNISEKDGTVYGIYSNGSQRALGQIGLATFNNSAGLVRLGGNSFTVGLNSGLARVSAPGAGDKGTIASGYSEGSNVDLSREFTSMILAQRGFQASSRIINTSDEMLQELVNLKR
ncbi:MAG: flagellar hook protein FlgE [Anaerolineaceae bacterium]|nr:flagellar hook protein FlgE [Anaerolineaceae bacterium]